MKTAHIIKILRRFQKEKQKKYSIRKIGIFGSAAQDSSREHSDIDVVVELEK